MPSYRATLRFLYGLQLRGVKLGLTNTRLLLRGLGNPHRSFPTIHVAGTNGKGSTSAVIASILQEAGFRTGLYTSPHLVRFTERIRIDGVEMPEPRLVEYAGDIRTAVEQRKATFFEATTCIALKYFADEQVDVAVIETGLGGRFDSTNVITPLVSVITNISLEHTELLGDTIAAIAREKAGIIKPGVPVVTGAEHPDALRVFASTAKKRGSRLRRTEDLVRVTAHGGGAVMRLRGGMRLIVNPGYAGEHQLRNAALAVAALRAIRGSAGGTKVRAVLSGVVIRRGIERARRNSGLRGRMEPVRLGNRRFLFDVAHNPDGMKTLAAAFRGARPAAVVFGMLKDKDAALMLPAAAALGGRLICVTPRTPRGIRSAALMRKARDLGLAAVNGGTVEAGLEAAIRAGRGTVIVCGSHYVVGPAMECLGVESA